MKRSLVTTTGLAGAALAATACSGSGGYAATRAPTPPTTAATQAATPAGSSVGLGSTPLGQILVDSQGRTLYLFAADTSSSSTCNSPGCVAEWPPFTTTGPPQAGPQVAANRLATTLRFDGREQVTYSGHPLYYFAGDTQRGSTAGQGLNDNGGPWYVVRADGTAVVNS